MSVLRFTIPGMEIIPLPAFRDNYIWLLRRGHHAVVVDPGDAGVVERFLAEQGLQLAAILVTHHHDDHVGGLEHLHANHRCPVFGPAGEAIAGLTRRVAEPDTVVVPELDLAFRVLDVPGHTAGHIAYHAPGLLFCGDTLFSAGCGRLFEGSAAQLFASLEKLAALPDDTRVYCTHEYTLSNLRFARAVEPRNDERDRYHAECEALRAAGRPTLPSSIGLEKRINPFLRTWAPQVIEAVTHHRGTAPAGAEACFAELRAWKDVF